MGDAPAFSNAHTGWTKCRACKADIVFAIMHTSGKNSPFEKDDAGEWVIENGIAKHEPKPAPAAQPDLFAAPGPTDTRQRWTSHFARCPKADEYRKR